MAFSENLVEGGGVRVLTQRSTVERSKARAMVLNEPKASDTPFLGLSDEVSQDVSFAPGTFIEGRRFILFEFFFLLLFSNVPLYPETK